MIQRRAKFLTILFCSLMAVSLLIAYLLNLHYGSRVVATIHAKHPVVAVTWSPDGSKLATITFYGEVDLWYPNGKLLRHLGRVSGPVVSHDLGFFEHGRYLVTIPNALIPGMDVLSPGPDPIKVAPPGREKEALAVWEVDTGRVIRHVEGPPLTPGHVIESPGEYAVSPDGMFVALCPSTETRLTIYETTGWKIVKVIEGSRPNHGRLLVSPSAFVFSPDSRHILIGGEDEVTSYPLPSSDEPRDFSDAEPIQYPFPGSSNSVFSPDGALLATDGAFWSEALHSPYEPRQSPYRIRIWRFSDQAMVAEYPERFNTVRQASWSADGAVLAVSAQQSIRLYRIGTRYEPPHILRREEAMSLAFSPKGRLLAAAIDNEVSIFDIKL